MKIVNNRGFTLIELIITLMILGIIVAISTSSFQGILSNQALTHRVDKVYYTLQLARSEAIKRNKKVYVHFCQQGDVWKMGLSELDTCDCFIANSCHLDGIEKVQDLVDGKTLFIKNGDLTFFGSQASYLPLRFSANLGRVVITNSEEKSLSIIQSKMRVRACSPDEPQLGYPKC